jgi:hypothetical protein
MWIPELVPRRSDSALDQDLDHHHGPTFELEEFRVADERIGALMTEALWRVGLQLVQSANPERYVPHRRRRRPGIYTTWDEAVA